MPTGRRGRGEKPTQAGPRKQQHVDAQKDLRNDPTAADYQTDLSAARNRNDALGDGTGNAGRASRASGRKIDENAVADTRRAQRQSRGNNDARDPKKRF
jgi:hypothetical protein